jgi:hypothetical protein
MDLVKSSSGLYVPDAIAARAAESFRAQRETAFDNMAANFQKIKGDGILSRRDLGRLQTPMRMRASRTARGGLGLSFSELLYANRASFTAKASFTTEIAINDTAIEAQAQLPPWYISPSVRLPAGLRFVARGIMGTQNVAAQAFTLTCRLGAAASITAVIVLGSPAVSMTQNLTNKLWEFEGDVIIRTLGTTGATGTGNGLGIWSAPAIMPSPFVAELFGSAAQPGTFTTYDPSITNFVNFNATCGTSNAANTIQLLQLLVQALN